MPTPPQSLMPALERLRSGDATGARKAVEAALADQPDAPALLEFAGLLAAKAGDAEAAASHFRRLLELDPRNQAARLNLVTALAGAGQLSEAVSFCTTGGEGGPKLARLSGYVHQQLGRLAEAAASYEAVVAAAPDDFEAWNNLGNVRAAQGDLDGASAALGRAIALRPDFVPMYLNLSEVLAQADRPESRQALMREAARLAPEDARVQTELGLAEAGAGDQAAAEAAFRTAIRLNPLAVDATVELGLLLENLNRIDDLEALLAQAEANGMAGAEIDFLKAWALRRRGRFEEALPFAEAAPESVNPIRRAQLIGQVNERLGHVERAFEAYAQMNAASVAAKPAPPGPSYRELVTASAARLTPEAVERWSNIEVDRKPPAPAFIVGFPRSGTTLLDTLLMNLPQLHVLEEQPVLQEVQARLGGEDRLAQIGSEEAQMLRARYFEALDRMAPPPPGATVVDKFPLHMTEMPLIHRIFPDAKVIFVERHPCDAVLSCFISNFQLNLAMRSFTDLEEAARTYDAVFECWTRATALLPIDVHRIRYERMVEDLEGEMRPLLDFLGLRWDERVLDNRASAARRRHIRTASYAQVTEPIYRRAAGRWESYRTQLEPVLPILRPWAERMGYAL